MRHLINTASIVDTQCLSFTVKQWIYKKKKSEEKGRYVTITNIGSNIQKMKSEENKFSTHRRRTLWI